MNLRPLALAGWAATVLACGGQAAPGPTIASLGGDVAEVGDVPIPASLVREVARARGVAAREALDGLVEDALAAQGARARGLDRSPQVAWAWGAALARRVPERLRDQARAKGPPTDDELADVAVIHAVVLRASALPQARAVALARAIASSVVSAKTDAEFEERARAAAVVRITVERIPPFDAAGSTSEGGGLDPSFVAAAFALHAAGETSGVVETPFGWHVLRLLSRTTPEAAQLEERRRALTGPVIAMRVRSGLDALVRERRQRAKVEVSSAADRLLAEVTGLP